MMMMGRQVKVEDRNGRGGSRHHYYQRELACGSDARKGLLRPPASIGFGFSTFFAAATSGLPPSGKEHRNGYTRLDPEGEQRGGQVVLDPHAPLRWSTKEHYVQNPFPAQSPSDAMDSPLILARGGDEDLTDCGSGGPQQDDRKPKNWPPDANNKRDSNEGNKFIGIFLAAVSGLFFTLCSVMVKVLRRIDPSEVLLFRAAVQLALTVPLMIVRGANPLGPRGSRLLVYLQGLIGCLTVTCIFIAFARLPVGDAATIIFCSPIFVMVFSHVILREHCGLFRVFVIALLVVGVVLIAKPPFLQKLLSGNGNTQVQQNDIDLTGYGFAMGGTLLTASNFVCMRKLRDVHPSILIFAFSVMSVIVCSVVTPLVAEYRLPETPEEWAYAVLVGVFGLIAQSLLAVALRYESAGVVSVTRSMDIAVAYVIQITWFGDIPMWTSILGAFVVVLAVFTMAMEDAVLNILKNTFGSSGWC